MTGVKFLRAMTGVTELGKCRSTWGASSRATDSQDEEIHAPMLQAHAASPNTLRKVGPDNVRGENDIAGHEVGIALPVPLHNFETAVELGRTL